MISNIILDVCLNNHYNTYCYKFPSFHFFHYKVLKFIKFFFQRGIDFFFLGHLLVQVYDGLLLDVVLVFHLEKVVCWPEVFQIFLKVVSCHHAVDAALEQWLDSVLVCESDSFNLLGQAEIFHVFLGGKIVSLKVFFRQIHEGNFDVLFTEHEIVDYCENRNCKPCKTSNFWQKCEYVKVTNVWNSLSFQVKWKI